VAGPEPSEVTLTGTFLPASTDELLVALHGLGGSIESGYLRRALSAAERAGVACLLLNARGADRSGEDFSHAGLTDDLTAALGSPSLKRFRRIFLLGYSIGGHLALSYATRDPDPRLRSVVALCAPLDLEAGMHAFDRLRAAPYRHHVLDGLKRIYAAVAARKAVPATASEVARIRHILEWDELIVARRFGYTSAWDYYQRESVAPRLQRLAIPALYVAAADDPMVPLTTTRRALFAGAPELSIEVVEPAGHLAFPERLDLGQAGELGLEAQCLGWLRARA
jgi:predicted alpha/beta-fold hydrolase